MSKSLTAEDLAKLKEILDKIMAIVRVQDQLKSLPEGADGTFVKPASDLLEREKEALYEEGRHLIKGLK